MKKSLSDLLLHSLEQYQSNIAIEIDKYFLTYGELYEKSRPLIQYLQREKPACVAILMNRSLNSYISLFACAITGVGYMPVSKMTEPSLLEYIFELTQINLVITEQHFLQDLDVLMTGMKKPVTCIILEQLPRVATHQLMPVSHNYSAYIMMTSGSTGKPKVVSVGSDQVMHYITMAQEHFSPKANDRFSQIVELTFDLSVHDIFLCWSVGACLCVFSDSDYYQLAHFFEQKKITFVMVVPSAIVALERYKLLQTRYFQTIKKLLFCGEPLPNIIVQKIFALLPNIHIENTYGPTEATVVFTHFICQKNSQSKQLNLEYDVVPIGKAFPGLSTCVVKNNSEDCLPGEIGELWLGGSQVVNGYMNSLALTAERFLEKKGIFWYKTGDLVIKDAEGILYFKGRIDDQWQVRGQRIERLALELHFRNLLSKFDLALIPSPVTPEGLIMGIALIFISENDEELIKIRKKCQKYCVSPFIPTAYVFLKNFPLNANGKVDYKILYERYQKIERC